MTLRIEDIELGDGIRAWFTGPSDAPPPAVGQAGNLSHRRPHMPDRLAADRREAFGRWGGDPSRTHLMKQVHGAEVGTVDDEVPVGAELRDVDAMTTALPHRPLAVLTADCVPVLLASRDEVGVAHAGRVGLLAGVVRAAVAAMGGNRQRGSLRAAIGPSIGPCCYEVEDELAAACEEAVSGIRATTTWSTPSLDLPGAVRRELEGLDVEVVTDPPACTRCGDGWFSHRRDPATGRQAGVIVKVGADR